MNQEQCKNCHYYLQHYTFDSKRIFRVFCGHCTLGRSRTKQPFAKACASFRPRPPQEEAFVSKEYLSKELLQYMLQLELLPEITEADVPAQAKQP